MERLTGAQILVRTLIDQGVDTIFGYPGGTVIDIYDAAGINSENCDVLYEHVIICAEPSSTF